MREYTRLMLTQLEQDIIYFPRFVIHGFDSFAMSVSYNVKCSSCSSRPQSSMTYPLWLHTYFFLVYFLTCTYSTHRSPNMYMLSVC